MCSWRAFQPVLRDVICVEPAWTATFRRFHALAVDDTSRGHALASARAYGELLLELGGPAEALAAFEESLHAATNRGWFGGPILA
jgi:hypothetical protein